MLNEVKRFAQICFRGLVDNLLGILLGINQYQFQVPLINDGERSEPSEGGFRGLVKQSFRNSFGTKEFLARRAGILAK